MSDALVRLLLVLLVLAAIGVSVWGMRRGWLGRARRQASVPQPVTPRALAHPWCGPVPGTYLATTSVGDWLDRVVVHGLGVRSRAELSVGGEGLLMLREGAPDLFVPAPDLRGVRADRGIAGSVYERGGVVVVTWLLGDRLVDTGFRATRTQDHVEVLAALSRLLPASPQTSSATGGSPEGGSR